MSRIGPLRKLGIKLVLPIYPVCLIYNQLKKINQIVTIY